MNRAIGAVLVFLAATTGRSEPPRPPRASEALLRLVPADASVVLAVDDLRARWGELAASPLYGRLMASPAVRAWFDSPKYRALEAARDEIEAFFDVSLETFRDEVLGDSVVLAGRFPGGLADEKQATGLLLVRARDPALLRRLVRQLNDVQKQNGELAAVVDLEEGGVAFGRRDYPAGAGQPSECFVVFDDGTFALSGDEGLIRRTIARKAQADPPDGLAALATFREAARRMPGKSLARMYVDPRLIARMFEEGPRPTAPGEARLLGLIERFLGAMDMIGVALVARDDRLSLELTETFDAARLGGLPDSPLAAGPGAAPIRVPPSTLAVASAAIDVPALYGLVAGLVPDEDRPRLADLEAVATGLLLGLDLRSRILPAIGPRALALVGTPGAGELARFESSPARPGTLFPALLSVDLGGAGSGEGEGPVSRRALAAALENGLRTVAALASLSDREGRGRVAVSTREVAGVAVTSFGPAVPLAVAVDAAGGRLIVATSAEAVAEFLAPGDPSGPPGRLERIRSAAFPAADSFALLDAVALEAMIGAHRGRLVRALASQQKRPEGAVAADFDRLLDLARTIEVAYATAGFDREGRAAGQALGIVVRGEGGAR